VIHSKVHFFPEKHLFWLVFSKHPKHPKVQVGIIPRKVEKS
jgi:hypothetical protein